MERVFERLAERQCGVVSREQAVRAGLSRSAIDWRVQKGIWAPLHAGVYRIAGAPRGWLQLAWAAQLSAGQSSALSHHTAAWLHRLDGLCERAPVPVEVTVARGRHVGAVSYRAHRTRLPPPVVWHRGLRLTSVSRTLIDLCGVLSEADLELALDSAQRRFPRLAEWIERQLRQSGHSAGLGVLRDLLAWRAGEGATDSPLEVRVRRLLRERRVPRPRAGVDVRDEHGFIMRVDFAWPDRRIALHVDGFRWHNQRARFERDARQRTRLAAEGWLSLCVTWNSLHGPDWLLALAKALAERDPQARLPLASRGADLHVGTG